MVTVIVPVYNVENYLKRCIDSILAQSYSDIELILIDDGSTDSSSSICQEYDRIDRRVKYIRKINEGISITRFRALQYITGEYFCFVDSDDYLSVDCIELLVANMADEVDCVIGQHHRFCESGEVSQVKMESGVFSLTDDNYNQLWKEMIKSDHCVEEWNKLYRTKLAQTAWRFPVEVAYGSDIIYTILYLSYCRNICCIDNITYYYEYRQGSVARSSNKMMILPKFVEATKKIEDQMTRNDTFKKMFPAVLGHIYMIALTKYVAGDDSRKTKTIADIETLSEDSFLRKNAKLFHNNKSEFKNGNYFSGDEFLAVYEFYRSILRKDAWYYTRLYPAKLENNYSFVFKAILNKLIGRVKK